MHTKESDPTEKGMIGHPMYFLCTCGVTQIEEAALSLMCNTFLRKKSEHITVHI